MKEPVRKIAFLVDKNELDLLYEACLYGADADKNIKKAVKEVIWDVPKRDTLPRICFFHTSSHL